MWWVVASVTTANPSIRVHYIRHGMSVWNAEQAKARASGENDENVKALGKRNMFVDAPLSERGVAEALALRSRLFSDGTDSGELGALVRCATEKTCPAPLLFTSNLRRAIDTGLLALRPLLESDASRRMTILPALQESCHYTDCTPLALNDGVAGAHPWSAQPASDDGNGLLRAPSRALAPSSSVPDGAAPTTTAASALAAAANASTAPELLDAILAMHGAALAAAAGADELAYVRETYLTSAIESAFRDGLTSERPRMEVYEQTKLGVPEYNCDRRVADGVSLKQVTTMARSAWERAMNPITERAAVLMLRVLEDSGTFPSNGDVTPPPVVITAHSRLLRELLFLSKSNMVSLMTPVKKMGWPRWDFRGDASTWSHDCAALLASDEWRLSNTGVVSFDVEVCVNSKEWGTLEDGETLRCDRPTITLKNCVLGPGSKMVPRKDEAGTPLWMYLAIGSSWATALLLGWLVRSFRLGSAPAEAPPAKIEPKRKRPVKAE